MKMTDVKDHLLSRLELVNVNLTHILYCVSHVYIGVLHTCVPKYVYT